MSRKAEGLQQGEDQQERHRAPDPQGEKLGAKAVGVDVTVSTTRDEPDRRRHDNQRECDLGPMATIHGALP